ncbi:hypothetical protein M2D07_028285 [Pseudomonas sp. BGr12]|uniref:hypothetical protein n=1 Tax=unclassified Pseudomonas TaxID=196821 RepID=UPI001784D8FD|nr:MULTISPECIES: hypothetical protein [unclassified Pseudomonas]MBD9573805.1 hypothetical protein [Pseudomonas sp. PDM23]MBD9671643.1 hypothetical protein [Pseudomonas sp. PDM21]MDL2430947.1 hypothetical protein [Pseudomonas sp. BJa5]
MRHCAVLLLSLALLEGCSTTDTLKTGFPELLQRRQQLMALAAGGDASAQKERVEVEEKLDAKIQSAIEDANQTCSEVIGSREQLAQKRSRDTLGISLIGLAAGSVIAPALTAANAAANAPWIAAFSGVGGASAVAVRQVDSAGMSGGADITIANNISAAVKTEMAIALNESTSPRERYSAAIKAKTECLYYPRYVYRIEPPQSPK